MNPATEPVQRVLDGLEKVQAAGTGKWEALCPAHEDERRSLSIGVGRDGQALIKCHAGCSLDEVISKIGLARRDLFLPNLTLNGNGRTQPRRIVATYPYEDETGAPLYEVVRYEPKGFHQRRPDGTGGFIYDLKGVRRVLFHLRSVLDAARTGERVYVVEGEKDVLALEGLGLTATCNPGGAGKWKDGYSDALVGAEVVILPDNDDPGRQHAQQVGASLRGKARSVVVLELPNLPPKGDVFDWLSLSGTRAQLEALVTAGVSQQARISNAAVSPSRVEPIYRTIADVEPETVTWLSPGRVPLGKLSITEGDPGLGKTMVLLDLAARITRGEGFPGDPPIAPADVIILTGEDGVADTIRPRLDAARGDLTKIHVLDGVQRDGREEGVILPDHVPAIQRLVEGTAAKLVIVDVLNAFLSGAVDAYRDHDIRRALLPLKQMAETTGAAVICVRHLKKSAGVRSIAAGGGSIGIGGAARSVLVVDQDPNDPARRVLASVKCNLAPPPASLCFSLVTTETSVPTVHWYGASSETADSLAAARMAREGTDEGGSKVDEAAALLESWLGAGEMERSEVYKLGRKSGLSDRTVERAATKIAVYRDQRGFGTDKRSWWSLRPIKPASESIGEKAGTIGDVGTIGGFQALTPPPNAVIRQSCQPATHGEVGGIEGEVFL